MTLTPLITGAEGFPALERLVAGAQDELLMSFRIIDPGTRLRAPELLERGLETWGDLIGLVTARGVRLRLLVADFDPLFAPELHRNAWACASGFADVVQGDAQVMVAPHGQQAGAFWRVAMRIQLNQAMAQLRATDPTRLTPVQRKVLKTGPILRPVTLHQKFAVADGRDCVIGGLDVNERRFDTPEHDRPSEETWHDVSARVEDADFAGALRGHFADCWNDAIACGAASLADRAERFAAEPRPQGRSDLRLLRTRAAPCTGPARLAPRPRITDHEAATLRLFDRAERYIYLETQFLRHAPLADALVRAADRAPKLNLIVVLPAAPERILFDNDDSWDARHAHQLQVDQIDKLRRAFGERFALVTPASPRRATPDGPTLVEADPVYLHSKVTIVDDAAAVVGSANLNGRSMRWDTEASVLSFDETFARDLFERLSQKWLRGAAPEGRDPREAALWTEVAAAEARRPPEAREAFLLPFPLSDARRFSRRVRLLPDDMF
ncbi:phospholipase D-like domain-containing protein [Pseudoponticoccus marisrubri]|uniref:Phospholipase D n=1 Tax=Pseudoponticoccus marisrubri TaxID=1685382 RepID=A0A0W7WQ04_9RHOB|nr:phospholipase D family protein [Pseudoponticoccus marisrubri]KUF12599.1 cardiolipin synthase [Pseudoponticoccus marisrubri]